MKEIQIPEDYDTRKILETLIEYLKDQRVIGVGTAKGIVQAGKKTKTQK
ncbi:MAG: hypothetical protein ACE5SW_08605 [Nitrososphaeraceae archaeon]